MIIRIFVGICRNVIQFVYLPQEKDGMKWLFAWWILLFLPVQLLAFQAMNGTAAKEPEQAKVWNVSFKGNNAYKDVVLSDVIATRQPSIIWKMRFWARNGHTFNETELRRDVIRLQRFYQRRGFPEASASYQIKEGGKAWKKKVIFEISEGRPIIVSNYKVTLNGPEASVNRLESDESFAKLKQVGAFQPGSRYQTIIEPDVRGRFRNRLQNLGYAHAEVHIQAIIDSSSYKADVNLVVDAGPRTYFDVINIQGNDRASKSYIMKEGDLKSGELYSNKKIEEAQREIFNHHLFRFATISIPEQPADSTINLNVTVREEEPRSVRLRAGVSIEEIIRGQATWIHRNALGYQHRFSASLRASFINQRANINYQFPQIFNTKSSIIINPFGEHIVEPGFELINGGVANSFVYQASRTATTSFTYEFTRNREQLERSIETLPDSLDSFNISTFQISGIYGKGVINRQDGWMVQPSVEFSGLLGSASFNFQRVNLDVRRYFSLSRSTILATRAQGGIIFNVENDSLPANVRFFNGGTSRVRGFGRQQLGPKRPQFRADGEFDEFVPTGGRVSTTLNAEIRQDFNALFQGFGLAFFLDAGQVWENITDGLGRSLQYAAGGGVRYDSPIGPVRLDVGYILNPNDEDLSIFEGEDFGGSLDRLGFHLSIGRSF